MRSSAKRQFGSPPGDGREGGGGGTPPSRAPKGSEAALDGWGAARIMADVPGGDPAKGWRCRGPWRGPPGSGRI